MYMWKHDPYVRKFFRALTVSWPDSTGMDGVIVHTEHTGKSLFISGSIIYKAITFARAFRTGFIRGDVCYSLPQETIDHIRMVEFGGELRRLIAEEKQTAKAL